MFPTRDGGFWDRVDWSNWRRRVWTGEPERRWERTTRKATVGCAPAGTRPRDLRSSYITMRIYEGVPLTTVAREVGTSTAMHEVHHAGVISNWDGRQVRAEHQIRPAREQQGKRAV